MTKTTPLSDSPFRWVIPGVAALFIILVLIIGVGFYAAYRTEGEGTLESAAAVFIYPSPYVVYVLVGLYLVNLRRSKIIAKTFNVGAFILLAIWVYVVFFIGAPPNAPETRQLVLLLEHNVLVGAGASGILVFILVLEHMLLWPGK